MESACIDDQFSFEGYQVVRGEFFAHLHEPSLTFNNQKVSVNIACVRKLPSTHFIQFLVNPETKKLVVLPCEENAKDAVIWHTAGGTACKPKQITCRIFFAKIIELMNWNPNFRYKLLGKLICSGEDQLFVFDLLAPEIYQRSFKHGEQPVALRTPTFPADWQFQFGMPVDEHQQSLQVNIFQGYAVFGIKDTSRSNMLNEAKLQKFHDQEGGGACHNSLIPPQ